MLLKLREKQQNDITILDIDGRLHGADSAEFQEALMSILANEPEKVLLNLKDMSRVDSLGLRAFIMASNKVKQYGGAMVLCSMQRIVADVFDISGFSTFFTICDTYEEAIAKLS